MLEEIKPGDRVYVVNEGIYCFARAVGIDDDGYMVIRFETPGEEGTMRYAPHHIRLVSSLPKTFYDGMSKRRNNNRMISYCDIDGARIKIGYIVGEVTDYRSSLGRMGFVRRFKEDGTLVDVAWDKYRSGSSPCNKLIVLSENTKVPLENARPIPIPLSLGDAPVTTSRPEAFLLAVEQIRLYSNVEGLSEGEAWWTYVTNRLEQIGNNSAKPMDTTIYTRYRSVAKSFTPEEKKKGGGRMKHYSVLDNDNAPRIKDKS